MVIDLIRDPRSADLKPAERAMLDYALKLTSAPSTIAERDVQHLRDAGFDDRGIHDICAVTAYFAFVNRIADGLGVELETPDDG
ncbi:MAG: peroxidase [Gemmatimonadaceae bacterium]